MTGEESIPIKEAIFELESQLSQRYPGMTPLSIRKERAIDFFKVAAKARRLAKKENSERERAKANEGKRRIIKVAASDNWF